MTDQTSAFPHGSSPSDERRRRVLIVDDSRTIRALLRASLEADDRLTVVGEASDPYEAREKIKQLTPDVLTLDVEMPRMNGLDFLERLMRLRPMPVVMVSNRTRERSAEAIRALSLGAVDCVDVARLQGDRIRMNRLAETIVLAADARVRMRQSALPHLPKPAAARDAYRWNGRIVLIGSSTGGVDALERVLAHFPSNGPPVLVAQHMPEAFLRSFSRRLNDLIAPSVKLAEPGDPVREGQVLIGPGGDRHISLAQSALGIRVSLDPSCSSDLYVPSVDHLYRSALPLAPRAVPVILTGMGRDGALHLPGLRAAGAHVLAQTGESAVVDGMPKAARETGAVDENIDIDNLGNVILDLTSARPRSDEGRPR